MAATQGKKRRVTSNRRLWTVLARETRDTDVDQCLEQAADRLQRGTLYYKPPSDASKRALLAEKMDQETLSFLQELSDKLFLDHMQTKQLFQMYFNEVNLDVPTRMISQHLHELLQSTAGRAKLTEDIMDFYHEERLHLLRCQKHLLAFYMNEDSEWSAYTPLYQSCVSDMTVGDLPQQDVGAIQRGEKQSVLVEAMFKSYNGHLQTGLKDQLAMSAHAVSERNPPQRPALKLYQELKISTPQTPSSAAKQAVSKSQVTLSVKQITKLAKQVLKEKREILHILCLYFMTVEPCAKDIEDVAELVDQLVLDRQSWEQLCSLREADGDDFNFENVVARIRCLQVVLALEIMNVQGVQALIDEGEPQVLNSLVTSLAPLQARMTTWIKAHPFAPHHAPILLAWGSILSVAKKASGEPAHPEAMTFLEAAVLSTAQPGCSPLPGEKALPNCVFQFLLECARRETSTVFFAEGLGEMRTSLAVVNTLVSEVLVAVLNLLPFDISPDATPGSDQSEIKRHQIIYQRACDLAVSTFSREAWSREFFWTHTSTVLHDIVDVAQQRFPDDLLSFARLFSSLSAGHKDTVNDKDLKFAEQTFRTLSEFHTFTERRSLSHGSGTDWQFVDNALGALQRADRFEPESAPEIVALRPLSMHDSTKWGRLFHSPQGSQRSDRGGAILILPPGTRGKILMIQDGLAMVQWYGLRYSVWHIISTILDLALSFSGGGDDVASSQALDDHAHLVEILGHISSFQPLFQQLEAHTQQCMLAGSTQFGAPHNAAAEQYPLLLRVFRLLHRCGELPLPPIRLVAACIKYAHRAAQADPVLIWQHFLQYGVLTETGGCLRQVLYHSEKRQGLYPVTIQFLRLLPLFIKTALNEKTSMYGSAGVWDWLALYLRHVVHDVFADHESWRYRHVSDMYEIGRLVLVIWKLILQSAKDSLNKPLARRLKAELLKNVLHDPTVCSALLSIIGQGNQSVEALFALRKSSEAKSRIRLIEEAFLVVNGVLSSLPHNSPVCELERRLLEFHSENGNMLSEIAQYAKHTRSPNLPVLATELLTLVCRFSSKVGSQSVYSSLGPQAHSLLNVFVNRLRERGSTTSLMVAILGFVKEAVASQPGLLKLLLDVKPGSDGKPPQLGADSCLHEVLKILEHQATPNGWLTEEPQMSSAALDLVLALWHSQTTEVLRATPNFWDSLLQPLGFQLSESEASSPDGVPQKQFHRSLSQARVMEVLTLEAYYTRGNIEGSLQKAIEKFIATSDAGFMAWKFNKHLGSKEEAKGRCILLEAWERLVVVSSTQRSPSKSIADDGFSPCFGFSALPDPHLLLHVAKALLAQVQFLEECQLPEGADPPTDSLDEYRLAYLSSAEILSRLMLILLQRCAVAGPEQALSAASVHLFRSLVECLHHVATVLDATATIQANLYAAILWLTKTFWHPQNSDGASKELAELHDDFRDHAAHLVPVVWTLVGNVLQSEPPDRMDFAMDGSEAPQQHQVGDTSERDRVIESGLSLTASLLEGLVLSGHTSGLIDSLSRTGLMEIIMRKASEHWRALEAPNFVLASLQLIVTLSWVEGGPQMLAASSLLPDGGGLVFHVVAGTSMLWRSEKGLPAYTGFGVVRRNPWHLAWCECLQSLASNLRMLGHRNNFFHNVVQFVAARGDQLVSVLHRLEASFPHTLGLADLDEIYAAACLFSEMSRFAHDWSQAMPGITQSGGLLDIACRLFQVCVHLVQKKSSQTKPFSKEEHDLAALRVFSGQVPGTPIHASGSASASEPATPDTSSDSPTAFHLLEARKLFAIVHVLLATLQQFSVAPRPHFCSELRAQRMLFSPDTLSSTEHAPSLGTLLAALTVCKDALKVQDRIKRESSSFHEQLGEFDMDRQRLRAVVDQCLLLLVSQSTALLQSDATSGFVSHGDLKNQLRRFLDWLQKWNVDCKEKDSSIALLAVKFADEL